MKTFFLFILLFLSFGSYSQTYYIVRHAEKAQVTPGGTMATSDPPLSKEGEKRAQALKELLKNKKISHIFSTNTKRTLSTAKPLSKAINVRVTTYVEADPPFIKKLKDLHKNTLIVGHSNTIDDIANALTNRVSVKGDIPDSVYNNIFIVKYVGGKIEFEAKKYGK